MDDDPIVGLQDGLVRLVPHSPEWARLFAAEEQRLRAILAPFWGSIVLDIQHVGSTSIPGIPAKPIIDIAVAVTSHEDARALIAPLERNGYVYRGEHEVPERHFFHLGEANTTGRTHHLHVLEKTNPQWRQQIGFRDYLVAHPETAAAYGALKTDLAAAFADDRPGYLDGKANFITQVLRLSVPEKPLLWTTVHDAEMGISLRYAQDVVAEPVTMIIERAGERRRLHLWTADRTSLYFEVSAYADDAALDDLRARFVEELGARFDALTLSDAEAMPLGEVPAQRLRLAWDNVHREALFARYGTTPYRIIYDPRGPLNLAILETLAWSGSPPLA